MTNDERNAGSPWRSICVCVLMACVTLAVYSRVWHFGFVNYDDDEYVTNNPAVAGGLNLRAVEWAFSGAHAANYHPLTWISLQLDASLFGLRAGCFHIENVILHAINAILLFVLLKRATGADWPSAFAAFVFAVDPTHVESVAWITERKDVLSTFFLLLAMLSYVRFARGGGRWTYLLMLFWFALSLLAKQMGVTLPIVLLLLDYWPLRRADFWKLVVEKIPLVALTIAASVAVFLAQHAGGAVVESVNLPLGVRLQAVPVDYVRYLFETIWPVDLCVFHPYRKDWSAEAIGGSVLLLLLITFICIGVRRRRPWLLVGWLWFVVMLLPVIGLVQIGSTSTADRYLYLSSVGLSIMLAWSVKRWRAVMWVAASGIVAVLAIAAHQQVEFWKDSRTLRTRAIMILNHGAEAHIQFAKLDLDLNPNAREQALTEYETAARLAPGDFTPEFDIANLLMQMHKTPEAIMHYQRAMQLAPRNATVANNLGIAWIRAGRPGDAVDAFHAAINDDPSYVDPHLNLATLLEGGGKPDEALREFRAALAIDPSNATAREGVRRLSH